MSEPGGKKCYLKARRAKRKEKTARQTNAYIG